jgi:uncharacterized protein (DUF1800 family)
MRHFVADDPPCALVERLSARFLDTDGDLKLLIEAPDTPPTKLKRPSEG